MRIQVNLRLYVPIHLLFIWRHRKPWVWFYNFVILLITEQYRLQRVQLWYCDWLSLDPVSGQSSLQEQRGGGTLISLPPPPFSPFPHNLLQGCPTLQQKQDCEIKRNKFRNMARKVSCFVAFLQQLLKCYLRLGQVSVKDCPAGLENMPRRGYKQEKSYSENTMKPATSFSFNDPLF